MLNTEKCVWVFLLSVSIGQCKAHSGYRAAFLNQSQGCQKFIITPFFTFIVSA